MILNLGSINADYFYDLPHLPTAGETLAAKAMYIGLGGKGANQSVAASRAGASVSHIGAVGHDGTWAIERLKAFGVETRGIRKSDLPTAHAIVMVDENGENQIVIFSGANHDQDEAGIFSALDAAGSGDWLLLQNETSHQVEAARKARELGLNVAYSAAPFDVAAIQAVLHYANLVIMNEIEAFQFEEATGRKTRDLPVRHVLITKGRNGAEWFDMDTKEITSCPAFSVDPVDTTGAGDTFAGYTVAGLSLGLPLNLTLRRASAAAALCVTRKGTADAIPGINEVMSFLEDQETKGA
jgi:ribokinase